MSGRARPAAAAWLLGAALALGVARSAAVAQEAPGDDVFALLVATQSRPSFSILGAGARAAGMGGAFTALADDASAASFNPAGLALLVKPEVSLVLDGRWRSEGHGAFASAGASYDDSRSSFSSQAPNFAAFTLPVVVADRNLCLQLSYQRLIDFDYEARRELEERPLAGGPPALVTQRLRQDGEMATLSLAAAYQLTQRLSLGLNVSRWQGSWAFLSDLTRQESEAADPASLRLAQQNEWTGWNASLGVLLRYRYLNVGANLRSGFDGDYEVSSQLSAEGVAGVPLAQRVDATLHWPSTWTVGIAVKPTEEWFLTADFAEYDWDDMLIEGLGEDGRGRLSFFDLRPPESSTTRSTGQWRFGAEHTFFPGRAVAAARAGYFLEPRPQLLSPSDEKNTVRGWSLGAGVRLGQVSVDLAWQRTRGTSRTLELVDPEVLAGGDASALPAADVKLDEDRVFLSVLYQFASRRSLARLFRFVFVGPLEPEDPAPEEPTPEEPAGEPPPDG